MGAETFEARAVVLKGEEHDRAYARQAEQMPFFAEYQKRVTTRRIPVIALERA